MKKTGLVYLLFCLCVIIACTAWYVLDIQSFGNNVVLVLFVVFIFFSLLMSKDPFFITLFNLSFQFFVMTIVIMLGYWASAYLFGGNPWVEIAIRAGLFSLMILIYIRFLRKGVREVVENLQRGWGFFSLASVATSLFLILHLIKPEMFFLRPGYEQLQSFCTVCIVGLLYAVMFRALYHMLAESTARRENELAQLNGKLMQRQLDMQQDAVQEAARYRHDLHHHNDVIAEYARQQDLDGLFAYLEQYERSVETRFRSAYCSNATVNNILTLYDRRARQRGIRLQAEAVAPADLCMDAVDMVTLLANLLENAIEGCERLPRQQQREILCSVILRKDTQLFVCVENTCAADIEFWQGRPVSQKGGGIGTGSIVKTAEKYSGISDFRTKDGKFIARILLHLPQGEKGQDMETPGDKTHETA